MTNLTRRAIVPSDADRIHEWASNPDVCRYQPWGPNTRAETAAFVADAVKAWSAQPQRRWVWSFTDGASIVVGIGEVNLRGTSRAEISYVVHPDYWRRGIGTSISGLLTRWVFENLAGIERVEATCDPRNVASERVLRRTGLTYEGTLRHVLLIRDGWRDSHIFSILRAEWQADSAT